MSKNFVLKASLVIALMILAMAIVTAYADSSSTISGRLAAKYNDKDGTVTAMIAGYCEGKPVTIGPSTWEIANREFSQMKAEDITKNLCGENFTLKKVTKSTTNGKEIVADVVIDRKTLTKVER